MAVGYTLFLSPSLVAAKCVLRGDFFILPHIHKDRIGHLVIADNYSGDPEYAALEARRSLAYRIECRLSSPQVTRYRPLFLCNTQLCAHISRSSPARLVPVSLRI